MKRILYSIFTVALCFSAATVNGQTFTLFAGSTAGTCGDGGPATAACVGNTLGLAIDASGNVMISNGGYETIRKVDGTTHIISTIAGTGSMGYSGDGGSAATATFYVPRGLAMDGAGNLIIADAGNRAIRKISPSGIITTVAGTGTTGSPGDGGPATAAHFTEPYDVAVDNIGNIYVADRNGNRVRKINPSGIISTCAGTGVAGGFTGGGPATSTMITPCGVAADNYGNVFISDGTSFVRKVDAAGIITNYAGNGASGFPTDGVPATASELDMPWGLCTDPAGNLYIADRNNQAIRKVNTSGIISTVAYGKYCDYVKVDNMGNLYASSVFDYAVYYIGFPTYPPAFTGGGTQSFTVCASSGANSINSLLAVIDSSMGRTLTWSVLSGPAHGALAASYTTTSTGDTVTPTGLTYSPTIGYAGTDAFAVQVTDGTTPYTTVVNVTVSPGAGVITGPTSVCAGSSIVLSDASPGGAWSSTSTAVATVGTGSGILSGISSGTTTITYKITPTGCAATQVVTINPQPVATAPAAVCNLSSIMAIETTGTSGTWSSGSPGIATVSPAGVVTGASAGIAGITFTATAGGCQSNVSVVVNALPAPIAGIFDICQGAGTALSDITSGGTWSSSPASIATITAGGYVTGMITGSPSPAIATITYKVTATGCSTTQAVNVNPQPVVSGPANVCDLSSITVTESTGTPGTWTSGSPGIATVGATGIVTGGAVGIADITYTAVGGCYDNISVTVKPLPAAITGASSVCGGHSITLSDLTSGGTWSSTSTSVTSVSSTGIVMGATSSIPATATITYTAGGCAVTSLVTINPQPVISGSSALCDLANMALAEVSGTAGAWSSGAAGIASVGATGIVTGTAVGTSVITYAAAAGGCIATKTITVNANPAPIGGAASVCQHNTAVLTDADAGGVWSSGSPGIASVGGTGTVTGLFAGSPVISYTFPATGCYSVITVTVLPAPPVTVAASGPIAFCPGGSVTLNATPGYLYQWYNGSVPIPGAVSASYTAVITGAYAVDATAASGCHAFSAATFVSAGANPVIDASGPVSFCIGNHVVLTANTGGAAGTITYEWQRNGISLPGATAINYRADTGGIYTCIVNIATSTTSCMGISPSVLITVNPLPAPVIHNVAGNFVTDDHSYPHYQWYVGTAAMPGANSWSVTPSFTGNYRLAVTDSNGCTGYSFSLYYDGSIIIRTETKQISGANIEIYPNPASNIINIASPIKVSAIITGIDGKKLIDAAIGATEINISDLAGGLYFITVYDEAGQRIKVEKIVKE